MSSNASLTAPYAQSRRCDTTGLQVCLGAQQFIKLNAVAAVVFLLLGFGFSGYLLPMAHALRQVRDDYKSYAPQTLLSSVYTLVPQTVPGGPPGGHMSVKARPF